MSFLSRLARRLAEPTLQVRVVELEDTEDLAEVSVGRVTIPAALYWNYEREADSTSGLHLQDPQTGRRLTDDDNYPDELRAAGARSIAVEGLERHRDAQADAFGVGHSVHLVPEPTNPANPNAIAIRSADGRLIAGYVPADDVARVRSTTPRPQVGLVVWESFTARPRRRTGMYLLIGPSMGLRVIPDSDVEAERARRASRYATGSAEAQAESDRWREEFYREREARRATEAAARDARRAERERIHGQRAVLESERRAAGVCLNCGGPIVRAPGRGRPPVRCAACRTGAAG